jgi:hypothetical protein
VLGLDGLERAGQRVQVHRDRVEPPAHLDQRKGEHGDDDDREQDAQDDEGVGAHARTPP